MMSDSSVVFQSIIDDGSNSTTPLNSQQSPSGSLLFSSRDVDEADERGGDIFANLRRSSEIRKSQGPDPFVISNNTQNPNNLLSFTGNPAPSRLSNPPGFKTLDFPGLSTLDNTPKPNLLDGEPLFQVSILNSDKIGEGVNSYITYTIRTTSTLPSFGSKEVRVTRRFREFHWLHERLSTAHKACIIPPIADKVLTVRITNDFVKQRERELERFLRRVVAHPVLQRNEDLHRFLKDPTEDLSTSKPKKDEQQSGGFFSGKFMDYFKGTVNNLGLGTVVEDRSKEFADRTAALTKLEDKLSAVARGAEAIIRKQKELGEVFYDFGGATAGLSDAELNPMLQKSFTEMTELSENISSISNDAYERNTIEFLEVLKDHAKYLGAARNMLAYRMEVQTELANAENQIQTRSARAYHPSDSSGNLQNEIKHWTKVMEEKKYLFEEVSKLAWEELDRFESERVGAIREALMAFIKINLDMELRNADKLKKMMNTIVTF